ncbi:hypothetical protein KIN20_008839 [Parelaphostrongylus tenuis]|uniref:Uncharacterized protein n=1 Tax=Parelaphostrongylus tenuis TaxID=148309 RepID=A0AAD5MRQ4_PARTN|nr:hypothetical protein KIN20_008835 [Parelaphostrongylus tenuis]KAJ1352494.1 hypothetical protein KIN20_008839 [Parelaphostrongylus tenuis]
MGGFEPATNLSSCADVFRSHQLDAIKNRDVLIRPSPTTPSCDCLGLPYVVYLQD